jgi:cellulase (glycosyl hydrolase family 5)
MQRPLLLLAALLLAALAAPALAHAAPSRFDIGVQDPLDFPEQDPGGAYRTIREEGMRYVRVPIPWSNVAGARPANPTNPDDPQYAWGRVDSRLDPVVNRGLTPIIAVYAPPGWSHAGSRLTTNPGDFGDFMTAIARRYGGGAHPRVKYWQIFNEPNLKVYLDDSPARYRELVNAGYKSVKAVHGDNVVIAGGTAPFGSPSNEQGMAPFPFMRSVLKAKVSFDIWSHHPYTSGGPNHHAALAQDASLGDLPEMRRVLVAARKAHHIKSTRFWVTEFGWDSKPPDPGGVPLATHARWAAEAMYRMWETGIDTMIWFKLRDDPFNGDWGSSFNGGIFLNTTELYSNEARKPAADVLGFPFVAVPEGGRVSVWGRTPRSRGGKVTIDMKKGSGWTSIAKVNAGSHGVFHLRLNGRRGTTLRARVSGSPASSEFKAVPTKDVPVRPFGGG